VEAVSREVVTGFLAHNETRLAEIAKCTRVVNLSGVLAALREHARRQRGPAADRVRRARVSPLACAARG